jgi:PTS system galactitol-specific IIA component
MQTEYVDLEPGPYSDVLTRLGEYAIDRGLATEGYVDALLDREASFPTGLEIPTASFDIAIPHADPEHVIEPALVLALPSEPVPFHDMNDPDDTVEARVVLLLVAGESERYATFLSNLANLFQESDFAAAVEARDPDRVLSLVDEVCL